MSFPKGKQDNLLGEKVFKLRCLENKHQSKLKLYIFAGNISCCQRIPTAFTGGNPHFCNH